LVPDNFVVTYSFPEPERGQPGLPIPRRRSRGSRPLPEERIAEIEDFVDFIRLREQERALTHAAAVASASSFAAIL